MPLLDSDIIALDFNVAQAQELSTSTVFFCFFSQRLCILDLVVKALNPLCVGGGENQ